MADNPRYRVSVPDAEFFKQLIPCQAACPVHTDAGRYVQLIAQGEYEQAYLTACSPNPFASVCGRVCAAPCEDRCRRGVVDKPVSIRALKGFVCELYGPESSAPLARQALAGGATEQGNKVSWHLPILAESRKQVGEGKKVAIIGAGPSGLSCAHDLAVMGYQPTVFEASATVGGMMVQGIPEFRLNRELLQREIQTILDLGVDVKLNTPLSRDFGINELRQQGFEAVFLAVGTQSGRDVQVEGSNLDGIVKAVDFLLNINRGYKVTLGRRVVVFGGGFVAFDAARAALRTAGSTPPDSEGTIGPNGSGKSTTMKCIAGLLFPTRGEIVVDGVPAPTRNRDWLSYLPQHVSFPENLTGKEVLDFYRRLRKLDPGFGTRALEISNLNGFSNRAVRQYSGGMVQRLGIAIALMPETPVVLLDEPTAGLDPDAVSHFRELLTAMRGRGKTIIVSSHALTEVEALADRVAILVNGRLAACEPVRHFRERLAQHALMRITLRESQADFCALACRSGAVSAEIIGTELVVTGASVGRLQILRALEAAGAHIEHFSTEEPTLESLYNRYTRENTRNHSGTAADRVSV